MAGSEGAPLYSLTVEEFTQLLDDLIAAVQMYHPYHFEMYRL